MITSYYLRSQRQDKTVKQMKLQDKSFSVVFLFFYFFISILFYLFIYFFFFVFILCKLYQVKHSV